MGLKDILKAIVFQFSGTSRLFFILLTFHIIAFLGYINIKDSFKKTYYVGALEISNTLLDQYYADVDFLLRSIRNTKQST